MKNNKLQLAVKSLQKQPMLIMDQIFKYERRIKIKKIYYFWHVFNDFVRDTDWVNLTLEFEIQKK